MKSVHNHKVLIWLVEANDGDRCLGCRSLQL